MSHDIDQQRDVLRQYVIEQRSALTESQLREAARDMTLLLESTPEFHHALHIAAYWPVNGEMDVLPLMEQARRYNKHVYLPVIVEGDRMMFAPYEKNMAMKNNKFGIPEPDVAADQLVAPADMDIVLVPLVVFDSAGHRLGMGGGFYDRTFSFLNEDPDALKPCLVGAAHEFQHTGDIPPHPWDVPTRMVVTEERVWRPHHTLHSDAGSATAEAS